MLLGAAIEAGLGAGGLGMRRKQTFPISPEDTRLMSMGVYGEETQDQTLQKLIIDSMLNRYNSSRDKEFGSTYSDVLNKGYYAVKNKNKPYLEALSGQRDKELEAIQQMIKDRYFDETRDKNVQFYFRPEEEQRLRGDPKTFNFDYVNSLGKVGPYNTYGY